MIRKNTYSLERILPNIAPGVIMNLDDELVKLSGLRLMNFKVHGITCVTCGLVGSFFALEKSHERDKTWHLNLYAIKNDAEVLMTRDHILPLSLNGKNVLENLQTMCSPCNNKKGNGRSLKTYKKSTLIHLLRNGSSSVRKHFRQLESKILEKTATLEDLNLLILALNRTSRKSIETIALKDVPSHTTLQEHDTFHTSFLPINKNTIIVPDGETCFHVFNKLTNERVKVKMKGEEPDDVQKN